MPIDRIEFTHRSNSYVGGRRVFSTPRLPDTVLTPDVKGQIGDSLGSVCQKCPLIEACKPGWLAEYYIDGSTNIIFAGLEALPPKCPILKDDPNRFGVNLSKGIVNSRRNLIAFMTE